MSEELPTYIDFHGFNDFAYFFPKPEIIWTIVGTVLLIITIVSYIPQPIKIMQKRSSYGLAPVSTFFSTICLWLIVFNVICLKWEDFVALFHHLNFRSYARFLTFANCFSQYFLMSQVPYLIMLFYDTNLRLGLDQSDIKKGWKQFRSVSMIAVLTYSSCILIWGIIGVTCGFTSHAMDLLGHAAGIAGFIIEVLQFLPQIYKTFKMRSSGSLSLLMLEIQAPVNIANAMFMCFGNHESWTTYAASLADGFWEFVLLAMCLYFNKLHNISDKPQPGLTLQELELKDDELIKKAEEKDENEDVVDDPNSNADENKGDGITENLL
ncbi:PQ loop repeat family protein [Trichomonas vaginalis G3]|uniref:PQ loop repeat family protein n=1 Tax=Trichomonas vaginalis (strain ATCC PRA-98 / G3) TaxID=412133 RepID=A2EMD7_TRIV3|nr:PQ loop repeat-containing protein [Trichomonas vaginalis G3]EAY06175.1 PQ loop repeat family protein [Trichomonas vaginalis G3]KAI5544324.1 PQ loop repeat-containing protein [Trichomonas vaginalis G3]|eukprot:XP_001318398.1 PQ loop repeat family protein [Trichomonas vaginalis G3]